MKKWYLTAIALVMTTAVFAGEESIQPVLITVEDDTSGQAWGSMSTARFSDNDVEMIGCGTRAWEGGFRNGFCQATDAEGTYRGCYTEDSVLLDNMRATGDYSFVNFKWAPGEFNDDVWPLCTLVQFSTQSFYIPDHGQKSKKSKKSSK